jgi:hypothetical protein
VENYNALTDIPVTQQQLQKCIANRQNAYSTELGGWQEQLDMIFHNIDEWKSAIQSIKDRYPKPT